MAFQLTNHTMSDGSRKFAELPESRWWYDLRDHLACLTGVRITKFLTDDVTEVWIDFAYRGHIFSINNQLGDYWFFVTDPSCPDDILSAVVGHCQTLLDENAA